MRVDNSISKLNLNKMQKQKNIKISKLKLLTIFFGISSSPVQTDKLKANTDKRKEIEKEAIQLFKGLKGFSQTFSSPNTGKWFEMESALHALKQNENVEGFDLTIEAEKTKYGKLPIIYLPNGKSREFRRTQIDVSTKNHWIESKSAKKPSRKFGKQLQQFEKEKDVLTWFRTLKYEIMQGSAKIKTAHTSKKMLCLSIKGNLTKNRNIFLTCSWIENKLNKEQYRLEWLKLIQNMSQKHLVIYFKEKLPEVLGNALANAGIDYKDQEKMDIKTTYILMPTTA
jgi:hypothetical protein